MKALPLLVLFASVVLAFVAINGLMAQVTTDSDLTRALGYFTWIGIDWVIQVLKCLTR